MAELIVLPSPNDRGAGRSTSYIEPAPLVDVLFDQLEYLVTHANQECLPGCPDCARLEQVEKLLLVPFESLNTRLVLEPVAA